MASKSEPAGQFGNDGWVRVYLETKPGATRAPLRALLQELAATELEELTDQVMTARVPRGSLPTLKRLADVTPMDRKLPS
jgi:hypothetical protein